MKKTMLICSLLACAVIGARAADLPVRDVFGITNTSPATLTLPPFNANGQLVSVQVIDNALTNNTVAITQIIPVTSTVSVTNDIATLAYTTTFGGITNVAAYGFGNDTFAAKFGNSFTGVVIFTRTIAK